MFTGISGNLVLWLAIRTNYLVFLSMSLYLLDCDSLGKPSDSEVKLWNHELSTEAKCFTPKINCKSWLALLYTCHIFAVSYPIGWFINKFPWQFIGHCHTVSRCGCMVLLVRSLPSNHKVPSCLTQALTRFSGWQIYNEEICKSFK